MIKLDKDKGIYISAFVRGAGGSHAQLCSSQKAKFALIVITDTTFLEKNSRLKNNKLRVTQNIQPLYLFFVINYFIIAFFRDSQRPTRSISTVPNRHYQTEPKSKN